jgi:hypothetical protein
MHTIKFHPAVTRGGWGLTELDKTDYWSVGMFIRGTSSEPTQWHTVKNFTDEEAAISFMLRLNGHVVGK